MMARLIEDAQDSHGRDGSIQGACIGSSISSVGRVRLRPTRETNVVAARNQIDRAQFSESFALARRV